MPDYEWRVGRHHANVPDRFRYTWYEQSQDHAGRHTV